MPKKHDSEFAYKVCGRHPISRRLKQTKTKRRERFYKAEEMGVLAQCDIQRNTLRVIVREMLRDSREVNMTALLERADQAISVTAMVRGFSARLKEISSRATERLVIFKDNQPAAVIINIDAYQEMLDELDDLRIEVAARERLTGFDEAQAVSHDAMRARYARKD